MHIPGGTPEAGAFCQPPGYRTGWLVLRTAALSMASLGWKLLGPSSHRYPSPETEVMLPPTRSRASVTRKLCMQGNTPLRAWHMSSGECAFQQVAWARS